jgi:hypothetical protein
MRSLKKLTARTVKRERAEHYLRLTLTSFAVSVIVTRLFLALTDYPKIGGSGQFHLAHVLWGGLILFAATLVPLVVANRWAYGAGAILSGVGVGLFIDEVGKFITQNNDYFSPLAAPIIYALFLLTVLLYLRIRQPTLGDTRVELYAALEGMMEVLEHDLDASERQALDLRLHHVLDGAANDPDMVLLANALLNVLHSNTLIVVNRTPSLLERLLERWQDLERSWFTQRRMQIILAVGLGAFGLLALTDLVQFVVAVVSPRVLEQLAIRALTVEDAVTGATSLNWFFVRLLLEGAISVFFLAASGLLAVGRERLGIRFGYFGLLLSLTTVNLIVLYFDQFSALISTVIQFGLFMTLLRYRQRFYAETAVVKVKPDIQQQIEKQRS